VARGKKAQPQEGKPVNKGGRPTKYTPELADKICALVAEGMSLRKVCLIEEMPSRDTVYQWIVKHDAFSDLYAKAKADGAIAMAEEILDIADDGSNDYMEMLAANGDESPGVAAYKLHGEHIQRSRLRVDTRKWLLAKLQPKKYGDKVDVNHDVAEGSQLASLLTTLSGKTLKPIKDDR
jgi:hypothetical protein